MADRITSVEAPICDGCGTEGAVFAAQMTDSVSMDNLFQGCGYCTGAVILDWLQGDEMDVAGWEIRRLTSALIDGQADG